MDNGNNDKLGDVPISKDHCFDVETINFRELGFPCIGISIKNNIAVSEFRQTLRVG